MIDYTVSHLVCKVKPGTILFKLFDNAKALSVMGKLRIVARLKRRLSRMTKGCVTEIMTERRRFGKILVKPERTRNNSRDLSYLKGVRKACSVMVARGRQKDLRFIHKSAEGLRMNYLISVALELCSVPTDLIRMLATTGIGGKKGIF